MVLCPVKLFFSSRSYSKLVDFAVSKKIMTSSKNCCMGKLLSHIVFPKIRMSIKVDDMKIRIFLIYAFYRAKGYKMLSANHKWYFRRAYNLICSFFNHIYDFFRISKWKVKISHIKHLIVLHILIKIWTIGFKSERVISHYVWCKSCSRSKRSSSVKRSPK